VRDILESDIPEVSEYEILEDERYIISLMVTDTQSTEE
jgi:hypothetical protein